MYLERVYRQISLVTYGNEYLKGAVESKILDRHPLLFNHFPILRNNQYGTLLCGSASHMLHHLKIQGATKLSLHLASDLDLQIDESDIYYFSTHSQNFCIAVQFPEEKFKILILSDEKASSQNYAQDSHEKFYNYSNYYDHTEIFTLHEISQSTIEIIKNDLKPIDWEIFFINMQSTLYCNEIAKKYGLYPIPFDTNNNYQGDLFNSDKQEQYPLLPFTIRKNYASNLIENTAILRKYYDSASHPKNENSDYIRMNDEEKEKFDYAVSILDKLHPVILKHCANHYQNSGFLNTNYFSGILESSESISSNLQIEPSFILNSLPSETEVDHRQTSDDDHDIKPGPSRIIGLLKFSWYLIWCYCAIWTLTNFVVQWGNIVISTVALFYAIYKITRN